MTNAELVARWAYKAHWATVRRDKEIQAMRCEGASLRTIAKAAGLSHTAVAKILGRPDPAKSWVRLENVECIE